jgi:hypothetical protein
MPEGRGEVYVLAGADVAENRRLELLDNLRFWDALASRGPLAFDEYHHGAAPKQEPPSARGLWVFVAQGLLVGLLYAVSRGTRFGPPRPLVVEKHRSALEYVRSLGWLTRRSKVERELLPELARQLRRQMHERLGISLTLPEDEAARMLEQTCGLPASEYLAAREELVRTLEQRNIRSSDYARLARAPSPKGRGNIHAPYSWAAKAPAERSSRRAASDVCRRSEMAPTSAPVSAELASATSR